MVPKNVTIDDSGTGKSEEDPADIEEEALMEQGNAIVERNLSLNSDSDVLKLPERGEVVSSFAKDLTRSTDRRRVQVDGAANYIQDHYDIASEKQILFVDVVNISTSKPRSIEIHKIGGGYPVESKTTRVLKRALTLFPPCHGQEKEDIGQLGKEIVPGNI